MNYLAHLKLAQEAIEQGMLFEATEHMSHAADEVDKLSDKYQRGKDAVSALHSKLERLIGSFEEIQLRLTEEVIPKWEQVLDSETGFSAPSDLLDVIRDELPNHPDVLARAQAEGTRVRLTSEDTSNEDQEPPLFVEDVLPDDEMAEVLGEENAGS